MGLLSSQRFLRYRSSHPEVFCKKDVLNNFSEFTRKHLFLRPATLLKRDSQVLSCEFCEVFKNTFSTKQLRWLFLETLKKGSKQKNICSMKLTISSVDSYSCQLTVIYMICPRLCTFHGLLIIMSSQLILGKFPKLAMERLCQYIMREKCPNTKFLCSVFSCIRTEQ